MVTINNDTTKIEAKIIKAANNIFLKHGVDSATMGQIALEAGINRTSLNYYFRSKNQLLKKVLNNLKSKIAPTVSSLIDDESMPLMVKVEMFVDTYIDLIIKHPMVPSFISWELTREPKWIINFLKERDLNFEKLTVQIANEVKAGKVIPFKLEDLFVNIFGLCTFSFITKPVLMEFFFNHDEKKIATFMISRKTEVKRMLCNWLKPD